MRSTPPFVEVAPTRWSGSKTTVRSSPSEQGRKLPLVFLALVLVQRVGLELVLVDVAAGLDPLDRHVEDVRAGPAAGVLVVGVQVAHAQCRERQGIGLDRPG